MIYPWLACSCIDHSQTRTNPTCTKGYDDGTKPFSSQQSPQALPHEALVSDYDPFLTTTSTSTQDDLTGEGFAGVFREIFGPGFEGVF